MMGVVIQSLGADNLPYSKQADLYTASVYDMSWNSCNVKFLSFRLEIEVTQHLLRA